MTKKFTYEYDSSTELIIKSLIGKSFTNPRDFKTLFDSLIHNAYEKNKGRAFRP